MQTPPPTTPVTTFSLWSLSGKWGGNYTYILLVSFQSVFLPLKATQLQTDESASSFTPSTCQIPGTNNYGLRYRSPFSNNVPDHWCHKTLIPDVSFVQCSPQDSMKKFNPSHFDPQLQSSSFSHSYSGLCHLQSFQSQPAFWVQFLIHSFFSPSTIIYWSSTQHQALF